MEIEFKFQTVLTHSKDIEKQFPGLIDAIQSQISQQKKPRKKRRRPRKKKITMGDLIDNIIKSIE